MCINQDLNVTIFFKYLLGKKPRQLITSTKKKDEIRVICILQERDQKNKIESCKLPKKK
jgi:hypothetical protein